MRSNVSLIACNYDYSSRTELAGHAINANTNTYKHTYAMLYGFGGLLKFFVLHVTRCLLIILGSTGSGSASCALWENISGQQ